MLVNFLYSNFNILMIPVRASSTYIGMLDLYFLVVVDSEDGSLVLKHVGV
jgi:hypothetical protein